MRRLLPVLLSAVVPVALVAAPADAAGHQFRGHIETTAVPGPVITIDGRGTISGLGTTTMTGSEVVGANGALTGSATFVAANGDTLSFSWTEVPVSGAPPVITFAGPMTVTGGTGRLADRAGTVSLRGQFDFTTNTGWFDVTGAIGG